MSYNYESDVFSQLGHYEEFAGQVLAMCAEEKPKLILDSCGFIRLVPWECIVDS